MKIIFEKWFCHDTKYVHLINYKDTWSTNGVGRQFFISTNGAKKKKGDVCFDFNGAIGYLHFGYTNHDLQKERKHAKL